MASDSDLLSLFLTLYLRPYMIGVTQSRPEGTQMCGSESADPGAGTARERLDEDDHDLLTFTEVGERLRVEIDTLTAQVAELRAAGRTAEMDQAADRLEALDAAARRNAANPVNDANFETFFGYPGKARRTPVPPQD